MTPTIWWISVEACELCSLMQNKHVADWATSTVTDSIPNFQRSVAGYQDLVFPLFPLQSNQGTQHTRPSCKVWQQDLAFIYLEYKSLLQTSILNQNHSSEANLGTRTSQMLLTNYVCCGLKGQLHNVPVVVWCCLMKDGKDILPARTNVTSLRVYHLSNAAYHHVPNSWRS